MSIVVPPRTIAGRGKALEPRLARGIGKVAKKTVDPQSVEHFQFQRRVILIVRRQPPRLVAKGPGVDKQAHVVGVLEEAARGQEHAIAFVYSAIAVEVVRLAIAVGIDLLGRNYIALPGTDAIGIGLDVGEAGLGDEIFEGARVLGEYEIIRPIARGFEDNVAILVDIVGVDKLYQAHACLAPEVLEVGDLEALHDDGGGWLRPAGFMQHLQQPILELEPFLLMEGRVLGFGINPDHAAQLDRPGFGEIDYLLEGRDLEFAVHRLLSLGHRLLGAQLPDFLERKIASKPIRDLDAVNLARAASVGEGGTIGNVGGGAEHGLVPGNEHAVLGRYNVGLDIVRAHLDGFRVGFKHVLGEIAAGSAVGDDQRGPAIECRGLGGGRVNAQ